MEDKLTEPQLDKFYYKDCRDIKRAIDVEQRDGSVHVFAIAVARNPDLNKGLMLSTKEGTSLGPEVYDHVRDCYHVYGVNFYEIGHIPVNYVLVLGANWCMDIPLPIPVLRRYMSVRQKKSFDLWKNTYPDDSYDINYLQTLNVY
jgi:hypothetical protein